MSGFDDRKDAFEKKYAHQNQLDFEMEAKICKVFGLWVAGQLGLEGTEAKTYAMNVVSANLDEPGFEDVLRKVRSDLQGKGIEISEHLLHVQLEKAVEQVRQTIASQ